MPLSFHTSRLHFNSVVGLFLVTIVSGLVGCASKPVEPVRSPMPAPTTTGGNRGGSPSSDGDNESPSIDYLGLHRSLGLERSSEDLGYAEKSFDTCEVGYGYSSTSECRRQYFVVIHFQVLCRDSEGTISTALAPEDLKPLSGRALKWSIPGGRGEMFLDGQGFGQIKTTFPKSQRLQRLKLAVDNDFVYVRAGEVKRLVTPRNWCN